MARARGKQVAGRRVGGPSASSAWGPTREPQAPWAAFSDPTAGGFLGRPPPWAAFSDPTAGGFLGRPPPWAAFAAPGFGTAPPARPRARPAAPVPSAVAVQAKREVSHRDDSAEREAERALTSFADPGRMQSGQPLDPAARASLEAGFGYDFSGVRVHTDAKAAEAAHAVRARAYTQGEHIVFGEGRYAPDTPEGLRLVGHELAHVVQQSTGQVGSSVPGASIVTDPRLEREADAAGDRAARAQSVQGFGTTPGSAPIARGGWQARAPGGPMQLDADSQDFTRGYKDGLNGRASSPGPLNDDAMVDYDEGYKKGKFERTNRTTSSAAFDAPPGSGGGMSATLSPTPDAVSGIHLEFTAPPLPSAHGTDPKRNFKKGPYLLAPNLRDTNSNNPKVVFYYAYRLDKGRNEYVVGPDSLDTFTGNIDTFTTIADTAYADPAVLDYAMGFADAVWDQQGDTVIQQMKFLHWDEAAAFYEYWGNVVKQERDQQRTPQERRAKQVMAAKVLPVVNAAMVAGAGLRLMASPRGLPAPPGGGAAPRTGAPAAEAPGGAGAGALAKPPAVAKPPPMTIPEELRELSGAEAAAKMGLPEPPAGYRWMKTGEGKLVPARKPGTAGEGPKLNYNPATKQFEPEPAPAPKPAVVPATEEVAVEFEAGAKRAVEARAGVSGVPAGKTGARAPDGTQTVSGWGNDVHSLDKVKALSEEIGQPLSPTPALDAPGYPGSYNLSHAEKQLAVIRPNQPIGVSRVMCLHCQQFFQRLANATGRPQIVADPSGIRIFVPQGTVASGPNPLAAAVAAANAAAAAQKQKENERK